MFLGKIFKKKKEEQEEGWLKKTRSAKPRPPIAREQEILCDSFFSPELAFMTNYSLLAGQI